MRTCPSLLMLLTPALLAVDSEPGLATLLALPNQVQSASLFLEDEMVVAASVSLIDRSTWELYGARSTDDAIYALPGLTPVQHDAFREPALRGFSNAAPSGSLTRLDGMSLAGYDDGRNVAPGFDPGLLRNIQLVRGPASALYGSPAFLGLISESTRTSLGDESEVQADLTSDHRQRAMGYASRSLGSGWRLSAGAAGLHQGDQDLRYRYTDPTDGARRGGAYAAEERPISALGRLEWKGGPLSIDNTFYHHQVETDRTAGSQRHIWEAWLNDRIPFLHDYYQDLVAEYQDVVDHPDLYPDWDPVIAAESVAYLQGIIDLLPLDAQSASAQRDRAWMSTDQRFQALRVAAVLDLPAEMSVEMSAYQWHNTYARAIDMQRANPELFNPPEFVYLEDLDYRRSQQSGVDLYLKQRTNPARVQWVLGASFLHQAFDKTWWAGRVANEDLYPSPLLYEKPSRTTLAGLGQFRWTAIPRRLHLVAGVRADHLSDLDLWAASPRAGVIVQPGRRQSLKLLWGRSFRAPRASELRDLGALETEIDADGFEDFRQRENVEPDYMDSYEVVWMQDLAPFRYDLQGSYNRWQDAPVVVGDPAFLSPRYDTTLAESFAGEAEAAYDHPRFRVDLAVGAARARTPNPRQTYDAYPLVSVQVGLAYRWPSRTQVALMNRVQTPSTDGPTGTTTDAGDHRLPTYWRTDVNVIQPVGAWLRLRGSIRNLLGRPLAIPSSSGVEFGVPESPHPSVLVGMDAQW